MASTVKGIDYSAANGNSTFNRSKLEIITSPAALGLSRDNTDACSSPTIGVAIYKKSDLNRNTFREA